MDDPSDALLVMAKYPQPGQVKTRLSPPLTLEQAAALYECFLLDTCEQVRQVNAVQRSMAFSPIEAEGYFMQLAPDFELLPQIGGSLGRRLNGAIQTYLERGYRKVVLLGSDSPTLPAEYLSAAFHMLDSHPVVMGPSDDGGYYLIGAKQSIPNLLLNVTMSTPAVAADTLHMARQQNLRVSLLPVWYDVDDAASLERLRAEFASGIASYPAPFTKRWLVEYGWAQD